MDEQQDPQQYVPDVPGAGDEISGEFSAAPTTPIDEQARSQQAERERAAPPQPVAASYPQQSYPQQSYPQQPPYPSQPYPAPAPTPYPGYAPPAGAQGYSAGPRERGRTPGWIKASAGCLIALAVVMACCALGTGVAAGLQVASTTITGTQAQSFAVNGTPNVVLDATAGNVTIVTGDSGSVHVSLSKSARAISQSLAQQALDGVRFDATQDGNTITITSAYGNLGPNPFVYSRGFEMTLTVPAAANLDTTLTAGNLHVTGTSGSFQVHSTAGNVTLDGVTLSGTSLLHLTAGNVTLHGTLVAHTALDVEVTAGNVDLFLPANTPAHLNATVTAGHVSTTGWATSQNNTGGTLSQDLNPNPTSTISIIITAGNASVLAA